jgi:hypothetical protein
MTEAETSVFVIDDDAAMREAPQSLLRSVGLSVETFASAREFLTGLDDLLTRLKRLGIRVKRLFLDRGFDRVALME